MRGTRWVCLFLASANSFNSVAESLHPVARQRHLHHAVTATREIPAKVERRLGLCVMKDADKSKAQLIKELQSLRTVGSEQARSLREAETLKHIYRQAPVGLCHFDIELRFIHINERLAALNGISVEEHLGKTIGEVLPDVAANVEEQLRSVIETGQPIVGGTVEAETAAHPGEKRHYQHSYHAMKAGDGTVEGVNCIVEDITEFKQQQEELTFVSINHEDYFYKKYKKSAATSKHWLIVKAKLL